MLKTLTAALLAASATAAGAAADDSSSEASIAVRGFVPVVCRAQVQATVVVPQEGRAELGQLNEFCNSPGGYAVYADHSAELASAELFVDGKAIQLAENGSTLVASSAVAAAASRSVAISVPGGQTGGTITFRIVPL